MPSQLESPTYRDRPNTTEVILVALSNPQTAANLLELALALSHPTTARILSLVIYSGDLHDDAVSQELQEIVEGYQARHFPIELVSRFALNSVAGIRDAINEFEADLLVLGVGKSSQADMIYEFGTIATELALSVACDVIFYRADRKPEFQDIVIPVDGEAHARASVQVGSAIFSACQSGCERLIAVHVYPPHTSQLTASLKINASLQQLNEANRANFRHETLVGNAVLPTIRHYIRPNVNKTLVILGVSSPESLERWLEGDELEKLLNEVPCIFMLSMGMQHRRKIWFRQNMSRLEQQEILIHAETAATPTLDYYAYNFVAALLGCMGLIANDVTAIIGCMLIAPIGQPITATALAWTALNRRMVRRTALTLLKGVIVSFMLAYVLSLFILKQSDTTTELMATYSNLRWWHLGVACAAGMAEAVATTRRSLPLVIAGAAVATALMPPLCAFGIHVGVGEYGKALESLEIFGVNVMGIWIVETLVFLYFGIRPHGKK